MVKIGNDWDGLLKDEWEKPYYKALRSFLLEEYKNGVISDFGRKYEIAMIPLDDDSEDVELNALSAVKEPILRGWYNGRNESNLHPSTTVKRRVRSAKDFVFTTLLIPFETEKGLPEIEKIGSDQLRVTVGAKTYTVDLGRLDV